MGPEKQRFLHFENEANRILPGNGSEPGLTILHDGFIHLPNNTWKGTGVSVPVFSLRTRESFGVGEFTDLKLLADWAKKTGLRLIQILPVNDTTATLDWEDSYPYSAISAFALHPVYLNLAEVAGKKYAGLLKPFRNKQKELNALPSLDFPEVIRLKLTIAEELYGVMKEEWQGSDDYKQFFEANSHWLIPYAAFSYLRDSKRHTGFQALENLSEIQPRNRGAHGFSRIESIR